MSRSYPPQPLSGLLTRQCFLRDFFGVFAMMFELGSSYMLLWPADGYCRKEELLGIYDGSVFPAIAQNRSRKGAFRRKIEL